MKLYQRSKKTQIPCRTLVSMATEIFFTKKNLKYLVGKNHKAYSFGI